MQGSKLAVYVNGDSQTIGTDLSSDGASYAYHLVNRLGGKIGYSIMDFWKMFEIDNVNDLRMCSALMKEFLIKG